MRVAVARAHFLATATRLIVVLALTVRPAAAQQRAILRGASSLTVARDAVNRVTLGVPIPAQQPRRHSDSARLALQFVAASAGAVGGGLATYLVFRDVGKQRVKGDKGYTRSGNAGYLAGSFIGATIGAQIVGTSMGARAPIWATSLGALIGTTPLIALGIDEPYLPLFGLALGWIPQGALAAGGFTIGRTR